MSYPVSPDGSCVFSKELKAIAIELTNNTSLPVTIETL